MVTQMIPELHSLHRHTESMATHGTIPSEKNSESRQVTPTQREYEKKKPTLKSIVESEHNLVINCSTDMTTHNQEGAQTPPSP